MFGKNKNKKPTDDGKSCPGELVPKDKKKWARVCNFAQNPNVVARTEKLRKSGFGDRISTFWCKFHKKPENTPEGW